MNHPDIDRVTDVSGAWSRLHGSLRIRRHRCPGMIVCQLDRSTSTSASPATIEDETIATAQRPGGRILVPV